MHAEKLATDPTFELSHPRPEALFAGTVFERFNLMHVHSSLVAVPCTLSCSSLSYKALLPLFVSPVAAGTSLWIALSCSTAHAQMYSWYSQRRLHLCVCVHACGCSRPV